MWGRARRDRALRYIGIDCPESGDWMAAEATQANRDLVDGETVYLEKDVSEVDRYDRLLRYVYLADGTFVNGELVRLGYARASAYPPDTKYQEVLENGGRGAARQAGDMVEHTNADHQADRRARGRAHITASGDGVRVFGKPLQLLRLFDA